MLIKDRVSLAAAARLATPLVRLGLGYPCSALAKADRRVAGLLAMSAKDHLVPILQESANFAGGQGYLTLAVGAQLHQAAVPFRGRTGDRPGPEQIAGSEVAPAASMVRNQLGD